MQAVPITQNLQFLKERVGDLDSMSSNLDEMVASMTRMQNLITGMSTAMHQTVESGQVMVGTARDAAGTAHRGVADMDTLRATVADMRDHLANFDDVARPFRNYFYWEPHCFDINVCFGIRSVFDALDGVDIVTGDMDVLQTDMSSLVGSMDMVVNGMDAMVNGMGDIDAVLPQMVGEFPTLIQTAVGLQQSLQAIHSSFGGMVDQMKALTDTATAMGQAFDASKSDDYFYLPPEVFANPDFQKALKLFFSPDGEAVRLSLIHI